MWTYRLTQCEHLSYNSTISYLSFFPLILIDTPPLSSAPTPPHHMEAVKSAVGLGKKDEAGEEPVSGETGEGTTAAPFDAGNNTEAQGTI